MGIEVTSLRELDAAPVLAAEKLLAALITAYAPDVDTNGVLRQLLIRPHALLHSAARTEVDRVRRASSLYALARDPELADQETVDAAMSNFALQRRQAARATCVFTLTFATSRAISIPSTLEFSLAGKTWRPTATYAASADIGTEDARLTFTAHSSGVGYWVQVPVIAVEAGSVDVAGGVAVAVPVLQGLQSVVTACPAAGGSDAETNASLVARAISSIAPSSLATREGIELFARQFDPGIQAVTVIGFGDQELARSRYNMFSIMTPGMADVYVRTATTPYVEMLQLRGFTRVTREQLSASIELESLDVRVELSGYGHVGAYELTGVMMAPPAASGITSTEALAQGLAYAPYRHERLPIVSETTYAPTSADAAFSALQGIVYATTAIPVAAYAEAYPQKIIQFRAWQSFWRAWYVYNSDDALGSERKSAVATMQAVMLQLGVTTMSSEFTAEVDVWAWVAGMPNLAALQTAVTAPENKAPVDYLVRAFNPCWVSVGIRLLHYGSPDRVDVDAVIRAIVAAVAGAGADATRGVRAADIAVAVAGIVGANAMLDLPITLSGRLRLPTDEVLLISSSTELTVPSGYEPIGVSPRTTAFYITEYDVSVELVSAR